MLSGRPELAFERHKRSANGYVIVRKGFDNLAYGRINFAYAFLRLRDEKESVPPFPSSRRE